jgi:hypothetical protein
MNPSITFHAAGTVIGRKAYDVREDGGLVGLIVLDMTGAQWAIRDTNDLRLMAVVRTRKLADCAAKVRELVDDISNGRVR